MGVYMKRILLIAAAALALTACKTEIKDGEVPSEHLSRAKQLEGVYNGSFQGRRGELTIAFEGNRPTLSFKDSKGVGFVADRCQAVVNDLKWVEVTRKGAIEGAGFFFDSGYCMMDGREVVLDFSSSQRKITVSIRESRTTRQRCRWEGGGHMPPRQVCETIFEDRYLTGKFSR
ncbi:hypothetical protein D3C87_175230 [compost metagenome]